MTVMDILEGIRDFFVSTAHPREARQRLGAQYIVIGEDEKVVDVEGPQYARRQHAFTDLRSFAAWMLRHANPYQAEIAVGAENVMAFVNGLHLHPDMIICELVQHPRFAAWSEIFGKSLSQLQFHQLVRAQRSALADNAEDLLGHLAQLKTVQAGELTVTIDERGYTRYSGGNQTAEIQGAVPPEIELIVPIFDGVETDEDVEPGTQDLKTYALEVMVSMTVREGRVVFQLDCPALDVVMRQARRDAAEFLGWLLAEKDGFLIGLGELESDVVRRNVEPVEVSLDPEETME